MAGEKYSMTRQGASAVAAMLAFGIVSIAAQQPPAGGAQGRGGAGGRGPATPPLIMTSTAWEDGGVIPDKYTQAAA